MPQHRFACIGDLHLVRGPKNADRLAALDFVIDDVLKNHTEPLSAWLWPGDLTDAGMTIEIRNALVERAIRMAEVAPVVIVPGNHDPDGDLLFLAKLAARWPIHVVTSAQVIEIAVPEFGGEAPDFLDRGPRVAIACVPYPSKAAIVSAGTPHDQIGRVAAEAFDVIFMQLGAQLEAARQRELPTLAIGHMNISGSIASTGQPQIGAELEVNATHLARLGDCPVIFNHIHKHQRVGSAVYPGSLCRMDHGEVEPKGYVVVEMTDSDYGIHFHLAPIAPLYHVEGTLTRDAFDWIVTKGPGGPKDDPPQIECTACSGTGDGKRDLLEGTLGCEVCRGSGFIISFAGCDLRVRASYPQQEKDVLAGAFERVKAMFPGARRFEFEPIAIPDRALRAPEVVQAQTFGEKLLAMSALQHVSWSSEIDRAAQELQRTDDGDEIVRGVEARLAPLGDIDLIDAEVLV